MKWMRGLLLAALLAVLGAAGCSRNVRVVHMTPPPPPPYAYREMGPAPGPGYVWKEGYWVRRGHHWQWVRGHWVRHWR